MNEVYQRWYKYIKDDTNDETVKVKAEIKIKIGGWGTQ